MFKDSKGKYLSEHCVVCLHGKLYTVVDFDTKMENCVQLANGCVNTSAKPEELTIVTELPNIN